MSMEDIKDMLRRLLVTADTNYSRLPDPTRHNRIDRQEADHFRGLTPPRGIRQTTDRSNTSSRSSPCTVDNACYNCG